MRTGNGRPGPVRFGLLGTVSHQFSPRLNFEVRSDAFYSLACTPFC